MTFARTVASLKFSVSLLLLGPQSGASGQLIDEYVVASGEQYARQAHTLAGIVVWQTYESTNAGSIHIRSLTTPDSPSLYVATYPATRVGVRLTERFVLRGASNGFPEGSPIVAIALEDALDGPPNTDLPVNDFGTVVAATKDVLFIRVAWYEREPYNRKIFAKTARDIERGAGVDSLLLVTELAKQTDLGRTYAASEDFFVWQDRDPEIEEDTWKIHAKRITNLSRPDAEITIDTNMFLQEPTASSGCYLDISGRFLLYQGASSRERDSPVRLLLLDLESKEAPFELRRPEEPGVWLQWPSISESFAVWTESHGFFERRAWAQPLENGIPVGAPFVMTRGTAGGSWITVDRNLAVWTGTTFVDNEAQSSGIILSELPLVAPDIGDVDQNGQRNLSDAVAILDSLFRGGWEPRRRLADTNGDGPVDLADAVGLLRFLFFGESTELLK
jgi:hypothetical protein